MKFSKRKIKKYYVCAELQQQFNLFASKDPNFCFSECCHSLSVSRVHIEILYGNSLAFDDIGILPFSVQIMRCKMSHLFGLCLLRDDPSSTHGPFFEEISETNHTVPVDEGTKMICTTFYKLYPHIQILFMYKISVVTRISNRQRPRHYHHCCHI